MNSSSEDADFEKCVQFHGHVCPGLAIGYRAARTAMERLAQERSADEELVAVVETDACGADAVQVLTGCTFGKGNFFFKDYGKHAFTLASRRSGRGFRVSLRGGILGLSPRAADLLERMQRDEATLEEREEFQELHLKRAREILETPAGDLFTVRTEEVPLPFRARMEPSRACDLCGEPTMGSKLEKAAEKEICRGCLYLKKNEDGK